MKFVFFGYDYSLPMLQRLLDDGHELISIFTFECDNLFNFNRDIIKLAQKLNVPFTKARPQAEDIAFFTREGTQVFISCGYSYKIPSIDEKKAYGINIHPSLLPRGRGAMPTPHIIMNEPEIAGFTIHKLTPDFDAGDILHQESITLGAQDNMDSYTSALQARIPDALSKVMSDLPAYWSAATPQDESQTSHIPEPNHAMRTISWDEDLQQIDRRARAFGSFGCLIDIEGHRYAFFAHEINAEDHGQPTGAVISKTNNEIKLAAKGGTITLTKFMAL